MKKFLPLLLLDVLMMAVVAWALMLIVGILHHDWWPAIPTIPFWPCVAVAFLYRTTRYLAIDWSEKTGADRWN